MTPACHERAMWLRQAARVGHIEDARHQTGWFYGVRHAQPLENPLIESWELDGLINEAYFVLSRARARARGAK